MADNQPPKSSKTGRTLVGTVGVASALMLLTSIPMEESGRKVTASVSPQTGAVTVKHISGPQYLKAYLDLVKKPTACDGITRGVRIGQIYTEQQCAAMLEAALEEHARPLIKCIPGLSPAIPGRDHLRAAMVSLAYHVGPDAVCKSTIRFKIAAGNLRAACDTLPDFNKSKGRIVPGFVARRARERALCLKDAA